ncbi:hypothetical protein HDU83_002884 [Entophlyctis luteolus]|nr:hypothetical protein HDU82_000766 [Entophlyctis luteolus]KAJ3346564.1 hypothetical protein HDU83_002884 [Entophlyctis luteolus]
MPPRAIKKNDRQSLGISTFNQPMKKNGCGKFNFGSPQDDVFDFYMETHFSPDSRRPSQSLQLNKVQVVEEAEFMGMRA